MTRPLIDRLRAMARHEHDDLSIGDEAADEIEHLRAMDKTWRAGHDRYETARRMSPRQWADAWNLNISTGKGIDEIVDDLRPFR